jgi:hypothetical protein
MENLLVLNVLKINKRIAIENRMNVISEENNLENIGRLKRSS